MSEPLKRAALSIFSEKGYEGATLALIADEVGLKKQSIYAHYKNKDDLFLQVLRDAFDVELHALQAYMRQSEGKPLREILYGALQNYATRYRDGSHLKFCLRASFFPPSHLFAEADRFCLNFLNEVQSMFRKRFDAAEAAGELGKADAATATLAFMALIDAVCVELVYGSGGPTEDRLQAAWTVYWNGIC